MMSILELLKTTLANKDARKHAIIVVIMFLTSMIVPLIIKEKSKMTFIMFVVALVAANSANVFSQYLGALRIWDLDNYEREQKGKKAN